MSLPLCSFCDETTALFPFSCLARSPRLVLTYSDIAKHYGSDWSASGIEHFFRPIKKNGQAIQGVVKRGEDAANFNHNAVS